MANKGLDYVQPGKTNARDNVTVTFPAKAHVFTPHKGRGDQEHPGVKVSFEVACITELTLTSERPHHVYYPFGAL